MDSLERAVEQLKAAEAGQALDTGARIIAARADCSPLLSRDQLLTLAADDDAPMQRIARGWLRAGYVATTDGDLAALDPDTALIRTAAWCYARPLEFTLFSQPWADDASLRLVRMPEPWDAVFESEFGLESWAMELFAALGDEVRKRGFDGTAAVPPIRCAVASGHGISKTFTVSHLLLWLLCTRPNAKAVITAATAPQLATKTWPQIATTLRRSLYREWWTISNARGAMRIQHRERPESWRADALTADPDNAQSFAGGHAADSSYVQIFDEASAIDDRIWTVAEGATTDGEPHWYAFGNPTVNSGYFYEAFNAQRHRWLTRTVDSRTCQITNKEQLDEWVSSFGEDSDFVRIRVRGLFGRQSSIQLISRSLVDDAVKREVQPIKLRDVPIIGVDVARFGSDQSVFCVRVGRNAREIPMKKFRGMDSFQLAGHLAGFINELKGMGLSTPIVAIDGGGVGGPLVDQLRGRGFDKIHDVQFGGRADEPKRFANKRAEMWSRLKDWLAVGGIPNDAELLADLTAPEYGFTPSDQLLLERKESMKSRGAASPDCADALALTLAIVTPEAHAPIDDWERSVQRKLAQKQQRWGDYNPLDYLDR